MEWFGGVGGGLRGVAPVHPVALIKKKNLGPSLAVSSFNKP